jgi:hypothetical protein
MSDSFEFTLHSPLTKEDWNKLSDAELENTISVTFQTSQGRQVKYIKCEVLDKIKAEIEQITDTMGVSYNQYISKIDILKIIDKYIEREG